MSIDNINIDQIRGSSVYDFNKIFDRYISDSDAGESPLSYNDNKCRYYDTSEMKDLLDVEKCSNNFSIFALNCRSIYAHWDPIKSLLAEMSSLNFSFDIIGFSETFDVLDCDDFKLEGYHPFEYKSRPKGDDGHGGVGMFVKDNIVFKKRPDLSIFIPHIIETIFIEIEMEKQNNVVLGIIYRPNTLPKADLDIFTKSITDILYLINDEKKSLVLAGDFNIDLLKFESHSKTNDFLEDMFAEGVLLIITKPTRITEHSATLIDHIYVNHTDCNIRSGIVITDISDHLGTFAIIKKRINYKTKQTVHARSFKPENVEHFRNILNGEDFTLVTQSVCPHNAYSIFMNKFNQAYNKAFPIRSFKTTSKFIKKVPWFTAGLLTSSIHKIKLYKKQIANPSVENVEVYKTYKTIYNRLCREAKKSHYSNLLHSYKKDIKKCWSVLKEVINKHKQNRNISTVFCINGDITTDKMKIAESFNNFFTDIGSNLANKIEKQDTVFNRHLTKKLSNSFFFSPITDNDVILAANHLKPKLSQGMDGISSKLTKSVIDCIVCPLTHIFNLSLSEGVIPDNLKVAKVIPIFKSGDEQLLNNYRPISLLPVFSKLLEKVVFNQLTVFLDKYEILYKHQYGFRKHHSTIHPLTHFIKSITTNNDKPTKELTVSIFLDLSKAFDTINHDILLCKLYHYGIRGVANNWFRNYLSNRKQYTEYQSVVSPLSTVTHGVPQGSILGPLLFLIYINDLPNATSLEVLSFADDTTIYSSGHNHQHLFETLNLELNKLYIWLCENQLSLNITKTKYMVFGPHGFIINPNLNIKINNVNIQRIGAGLGEETTKFLGINFDQNLTWKPHVDNICKKISKAVFALNKVKNVLPQLAMKTLYFALIQSQLSYGLLAWGNSTSILRVLKLQKKCIRLIAHKSYRAHTEPLFKKFEILKVTDLYKLQATLFIHDYLCNNLPHSFRHFYPERNETYNLTRRSNARNIYYQCPRTNFSKNSLYINACIIWNNLDTDMKCENIRSTFIKKQKHKFLENYEDVVCYL